MEKKLQIKSFKSVDDVLKDITKDFPDLADGIQKADHETKLVRSLIAMRAASGLTQAELAAKMNSTQSRISKLEHGTDDNITIGELKSYARATGFCLSMNFFNASNASGMIKYHASAIREQLKHIVKIAGDDKAIQKGVDILSLDLFFNLCKMIDDETTKLQNSTFQKLKNIHNSCDSSLILNTCGDFAETTIGKK